MKTWRKLSPFVVYFLIALLACSAILSDDRLVGARYEGATSLWATWWPPHALRANYDLVQNSYAAYPIETNWLPALSLPTSLFYAVTSLLGPRLGFNLLFPLYLTLGAGMTYLFIRRTLPRGWNGEALAFLIGMGIAFNPLTYALVSRGEIALLGFFVLPLWVLIWDRFTERPSWGWLLAAVVGLYAALLMNLQFINLLLTFLLPYAAYRVASRRELSEKLLFGFLGIILLFLLFPASPLIWSTYGTQYQGLESWLGVGLDGWARSGAIGLVLVAIALLAPWEAIPERQLWAGLLAINLIVYALPDLMPLTLLGAVFDVPRLLPLTQPALFLFPIMLAAGILIGGGAKALADRLASPYLQVGAAVVAAIGLVGLSGWVDTRLPYTDIAPYNFYAGFADEPEDYLVIDVPIGVDSLARRRAEKTDPYPEFGMVNLAGRTMAYVPEHHKRIIGGLRDSGLTGDALAPYYASPLIRRLTFQESEGDLLTMGRGLRLESVLWRAAYVNLHLDDMTAQQADTLRGWFRWTGAFCEVGTEITIEIWRAAWHPAGCPAGEIRIGGPEGELAAGLGWHPAEEWDEGHFVRWAGPDEISTLTLWATNPATDFMLTISAGAPSGRESQLVEVYGNGELLGEMPLTPEGGEYSFTVPRLLFAESVLSVELRHESAEMLEGRTLTGLYEWFRLEPKQ